MIFKNRTVSEQQHLPAEVSLYKSISAQNHSCTEAALYKNISLKKYLSCFR